MGAADEAAEAVGVFPSGVVLLPVRGAELAADEEVVEYSLAVEEELDDGAVVEPGAVLLEVDGLSVAEGMALGPGTST